MDFFFLQNSPIYKFQIILKTSMNNLISVHFSNVKTNDRGEMQCDGNSITK